MSKPRFAVGSWMVTVCAALMLAHLYAGTASAQRPRGADTISQDAAAESLAVIAQLKSRVLFHYGDTAAWHRLGMAAWALAVRAKSADAPHDLDATRLGRLADSSLRIAAALAPQSVDYRVDVGRYLLDADVAAVRVAARSQFEKALTIARGKDVEPDVHARAALMVGRTFWWRYDIFANRALYTGLGAIPRSVSDAMQPLARSADALDQISQMEAAALALKMSGKPVDLSGEGLSLQQIAQALAGTGGDASVPYEVLPQTTFKDARQLLQESTQALPSETGSSDFERAFALFGEAYAADPAYPGAFRAVAMVYADHKLWRQLESVARDQIRIAPRDSLAWLALGLAAHRLEKDVEARAAFDTALIMSSPAERERLDNWARITSRARKLPLAGGSAAEQSGVEQLYWMVASPIWADNGGETKIEFLARVTYAELRWTIEEFGLSGADSDRGDVYVRYGPPDKTIVIGPNAADAEADVTTFWLYSSGLMFAFYGMPTYGTAHTAFGDRGMVEAIEQAQPVRWDNMSVPAIDSLPAQTARFRAGVDSVDVVVAALLPAPDSIKRSMEMAGDVQRYFWLLTPALAQRFSDAAVADTAGVYRWATRVAQGTFLYRVEEFGETAKRAGRATGTLDAGSTAFPLHGFGISDLLIVNKAEAPSTATRLSGMHVAPTAGVVRQGGQLSVVWENYEFTPQNGSAEYDATLTIKREHASSGRISAQIAGVLASLAKRNAAASNEVSFSFSRTTPGAPAFADVVTLELGDTPAGTYTLRLNVTDRVTGRSVARTTQFTIRQ